MAIVECIVPWLDAWIHRLGEHAVSSTLVAGCRIHRHAAIASTSWSRLLASGYQILLYCQPVNIGRKTENADLSVPSQIDLQRLSVVLEAQRRHRKQDVFAIDGLSLFLLAFLGCCKRSVRRMQRRLRRVAYPRW